jgi:hypothetical protein
MCDINDNMEYLGYHLKKLQNLRKIYFCEFLANDAFGNIHVEIKKLVANDLLIYLDMNRSTLL